LAYLALYREWRPQSFREIVGQEHVTRTLQNALVSGRVGHAYLFCGPRGTGKTTTAKVLAKALNCRSRESAEPCNACANCREITAGNSLDVIEIDAASHRGIDEIRDLREKVRFAPTTGSYRVYIVDEVHMLTSEAFNALLKTLEEPPAHAVFVLATTEPHKVPLTILSRCQRFDFHRIGVPHLLARLKEVCRGADLAADDDALYLIARAAEGGLRDALSILDQVAAFGEKRVTAEDIHQILGTVRAEMLDEVVAALASSDAAKALRLVGSLVEQGKDLRLFVRELLAHLRNLLLLLVSPDAGEELSPQERERLGLQAKALGRDRLLFFLNIFNRTEQEMKWSTQPGILLEVALVQATQAGEIRAGEREPEGDLERRVARLEELLAGLTGGRPGAAGSAELVSAGAEGESREQKGDNGDREGKGKEKSGGLIREAVKEKSREIAGEGKKVPGGSERSGAGREVKRSAGGPEKKAPAGEVANLRAFAGSEIGRAETGGGGAETSRPAEDREDPVFREVAARWADFLANLKRNDPPLFSFLTYGWPQQLSNGNLSIAFEKEHELYKKFLESKLKEISLALNSFFVQKWEVRLTYGERPQGMDFSLRDKELDTKEALSLFGVPEEE